MAERPKANTTQKKVDAYNSFYEVFSHLYKELKVLTGKRPAETLSESKVRIVNRLLQDIKDLMEGEPENKYLDLLDDETLPQYSDAILILSQYEGALKSFKERHYGWDIANMETRWFVHS